MQAGDKIKVCVVGAGNIGSHAIPLLARHPGIARLAVIDFDHYEEKNIVGQAINRRAIGVPKALEAVARVAEVRPDLDTESLPVPVELVPPGRFVGFDVVLGCVDSLATRRHLGETLWRLGVRYLDAGVRPDAMLVRVSHFHPEPDGGACLQCSWAEANYRALEQRNPCGGAGLRTAPTGGTAALGALAAAHLVIALDQIVADAPGRLPPGAELVAEATYGRGYVSRNIRQPGCRFDHRRFDLDTLDVVPGVTTLAEALETARGRLDRSGAALGEAQLVLMGKALATRWTCAGCGRLIERLQAWHPAADGSVPCPHCEYHTARPIGFHIRDALPLSEIETSDLNRTLADVGIFEDDIFSVRIRARELHYHVRTAEHRDPSRVAPGRTASSCP